MATLTRSKLSSSVQDEIPLVDSAVPAPFPRELLEATVSEAGPSAHLSRDDKLEEVHELVDAGPSSKVESLGLEELAINGTLQNELLPSIASVQRSMLMILNDLLSAPTKWSPIVPGRRHSMPHSPCEPSAAQVDAELSSSSSALFTLVSNLRNRDSAEGMIEIPQPTSDSELIHELHMRVEHTSTTLDPPDAQFALALVSLLSYFNRLSSILASSQPLAQFSPAPETPYNSQLEASSHRLDTLKRQLNDFQHGRITSQSEALAPGISPVVAVESALLWSRIDEELEAVVSMCKERSGSLHLFASDDILPPQYDLEAEADGLPQYDSGTRASLDGMKSLSRTNTLQVPTNTNEKKRLDLEAVTMAIDRLYLVAPQLNNQRVELKSSKLAQMERARLKNSKSQVTLGKQKEKDVRDLEDLLDQLGRANDRTLKDQAVILENGLQTKLEQARLRDIANKEAFVEQLAEHSSSRRLHSQDATFNRDRAKEPSAMLTLPEFIREALPLEVIRQQYNHPRALLTLPEIVREPPARPREQPAKLKKSKRDRSLSASSQNLLAASGFKFKGSSVSSSTRRKLITDLVGFDVQYIAENHENLHHILMFITVTGASPGVDIEAEVPPSFPEPNTEGDDLLLIKSGQQVSSLYLPGRTAPGKKSLKAQSGHYELKLPTSTPGQRNDQRAISNASSQTLLHSEEYPSPLLDAVQLMAIAPTSYHCVSCSLPLVQSGAGRGKIEAYRDLPSEHWQELIDAWMCHADQKLHEHVARHGRNGFWPQPGQAFVGGSYILFDDSSVVIRNLSSTDQRKTGEDWKLVRCLCGAIVGRCQESRQAAETTPAQPVKSITYRLLKYAIRPVSPTADPIQVPLSAFIVEDMTEFVQAHATYRFVIMDEEDELPRLLIWLFKPNMRIAYTIPTSYAIPKSGSVPAAKVLYKITSASERADLKSLLNKYPGFPQAEYLYYPLNICRRVVGLLKESNNAYPEGLRTMTGLDVGFLRRA